MRQPPKHEIAKDAIKVWKITSAIYFAIIIVVGELILSFLYDFFSWYNVLALAVTVLLGYVCTFVIPKLRWKRWRYELFDQEIYIQHGILIVSRTLVPMARVQHVDTKQGPILKRYGLASVTISTAATVHEIPALNEEDASILRDCISKLARTEDDDV